MSCPHCGGSLEGLRLDAGGGPVSRSFYTRYDERGDIEIVDLDDDVGFNDVGFSEVRDALRKGGSVSVGGHRGVVTGFSRDRNHVYVRFDRGARKIPVEEAQPVR
jgi:hypothetical protein